MANHKFTIQSGKEHAIIQSLANRMAVTRAVNRFGLLEEAGMDIKLDDIVDESNRLVQALIDRIVAQET